MICRRPQSLQGSRIRLARGIAWAAPVSPAAAGSSDRAGIGNPIPAANCRRPPQGRPPLRRYGIQGRAGTASLRPSSATTALTKAVSDPVRLAMRAFRQLPAGSATSRAMPSPQPGAARTGVPKRSGPSPPRTAAAAGLSRPLRVNSENRSHGCPYDRFSAVRPSVARHRSLEAGEGAPRPPGRRADVRPYPTKTGGRLFMNASTASRWSALRLVSVS